MTYSNGPMTSGTKAGGYSSPKKPKPPVKPKKK